MRGAAPPGTAEEATGVDWRTRTLVVLLRLAGSIIISAFFAVLLPVDWMTSTHRWLGLGEFPRSPVVDYLARSIAALYGFHGILLWLVSTDPVRYRPIVWYIATMNVLFGLMLVAIDVNAGMPLFWTISEGPPIAALGIVIGLLNRSLSPSREAGRPDARLDRLVP